MFDVSRDVPEIGHFCESRCKNDLQRIESSYIHYVAA